MDERRMKMPAGNPGDFYYRTSFPTGFDPYENRGFQLFSLQMKFVIKISYYRWIFEQLPKPAQCSMLSCLWKCYWHGYLVQAQIQMEMSGCSFLLKGPISWAEVLITKMSFFIFSWNLLLGIEQHTVSFSCPTEGLHMCEVLPLTFFFLSKEQILY